MDDTFSRLELALDTLTVFRRLMDKPALSLYRALLDAAGGDDIKNAASCYAGVYSTLREAGFSGVGEYLADLLKYEETAFAKSLSCGEADPAYLAAAERDMVILSELSALTCAEIKRRLLRLSDGVYDDIVGALPEWGDGGLLAFEALLDFYRRNGSGLLAKYRAFVWTAGVLTPVLSPDPIQFGQMVGYEWQRQAVLENTRALVGGAWVNNALLYGDSGTGKSATVKAMLGIPGFENLVLIEVSKKSLSGLPALLTALSWRPQKFILFIDDLSFEDGDLGFSPLKVLLEGSLGQRPRNVAVYVTSNRRQLVRQFFSERDEIGGGETVQEKTSLADRFGLRLPFFSLNQEEYLKTCAALAEQAGVCAEGEAFRKAALQWALEHGARTPRTARQFADEAAAKGLN